MKPFSYERYSYLRALEYELISTIELKGRVLDFGGGRKADYRPLLRSHGEIESINIDPRLEPTMLHDPNTPFPIGDATYDTIVSFNTLQHIRRDEFALSELVRILKPGVAACISLCRSSTGCVKRRPTITGTRRSAQTSRECFPHRSVVCASRKRRRTISAPTIHANCDYRDSPDIRRK